MTEHERKLLRLVAKAAVFLLLHCTGKDRGTADQIRKQVEEALT